MHSPIFYAYELQDFRGKHLENPFKGKSRAYIQKKVAEIIEQNSQAISSAIEEEGSDWHELNTKVLNMWHRGEWGAKECLDNGIYYNIERLQKGVLLLTVTKEHLKAHQEDVIKQNEEHLKLLKQAHDIGEYRTINFTYYYSDEARKGLDDEQLRNYWFENKNVLGGLTFALLNLENEEFEGLISTNDLLHDAETSILTQGVDKAQWLIFEDVEGDYHY